MRAQPFLGDAPRPAWFDQANCKGKTAIMYDVARVDEALALCAGCDVREPCREQARREREHGTWGGETEMDRHRIGRGDPNNVAAINAAKREDAGPRKQKRRRKPPPPVPSGLPAWKAIDLRERAARKAERERTKRRYLTWVCEACGHRWSSKFAPRRSESGRPICTPCDELKVLSQ